MRQPNEQEGEATDLFSSDASPMNLGYHDMDACREQFESGVGELYESTWKNIKVFGRLDDWIIDADRRVIEQYRLGMGADCFAHIPSRIDCSEWEDKRFVDQDLDIWIDQLNDLTFSWLVDNYPYPGGDAAAHHPDEHVRYQDFTPIIALENPRNVRQETRLPIVVQRCDRAPYHTPHADCIFPDAVNVWQDLSLSDEDVDEVAHHVHRAQEHQGERTYPSPPDDEDVIIPGSLSSGEPLTRMYWDRNRVQRNRNTARQNCIAEWGEDYTEGGTKECDEYPMATTYEGAWLSTQPYDGDRRPWYSSQPLRTEKNGRAGGFQLDFYSNYRLLDGDPFYVEIGP